MSYVDNNNDFLSAVTNYYNSNGKNVVKLTDYLSNTGLPFDVTYDNGMVSIGGQTFKPLFEDNGYAYVDKAELDKVLANYKDQTGLQNRMDIVNKYNEKSQPYYDKLLDSMVNRDPFSYKTVEMFVPFQFPDKSRGGNFKTVTLLYRVEFVKYRAQKAVDLDTVVYADTAVAVDIHAQKIFRTLFLELNIPKSQPFFFTNSQKHALELSYLFAYHIYFFT